MIAEGPRKRVPGPGQDRRAPKLNAAVRLRRDGEVRQKCRDLASMDLGRDAVPLDPCLPEQKNAQLSHFLLPFILNRDGTSRRARHVSEHLRT